MRRAAAKDGGGEDLVASVSLEVPCIHVGGHGWWVGVCFSVRRLAVLAVLLARGGGE